ncbi:hypothetical protein SAMN04488107_2132 [Geodermatophilus saharensis]|uniref:Alpha/beta hydrolase family protein n=1 Tax=Geodermatophilus saharensis TaxID=1137994 RepID=A0A239DFW9_9ACTN|nr:hypothetical protein [Geodermatophilus saharensis]SNS30663.1 hypothetical protein SAMN04488107_2132 [Geodermatophilus saharensis]
MVEPPPVLPPPRVDLRHVTGRGVFDGIGFHYAIPRSRPLDGRPLRVLVSQHGTRRTIASTGGPHYLDLPLREDDARTYDLVVVAPHFPSEEEVGTDRLNGANFEQFDGPGLPWIRGLVHDHLPRFLDRKWPGLSATGAIDVERFYFFGHSRGGQAVHMYLMRYGGSDIYRAASCGGELFQRDDYEREPSDYLTRLDRLILSDTAAIIGTADTAARGGPARRIESVRGFVIREVGQRVSFADLCRLLPAPPVPLPHRDALIQYEDFPGRQVEKRTSPLTDVGFTFRWTPNGEHLGRDNYPVARRYLFEDRPAKPLALLRQALIGRVRRSPLPGLIGRPRRTAERADDDLDDD